MQRHRPIHSMRVALGTVAAAVLLATVGGAVSHWATVGHVDDSTPTATVLGHLLQATPVHEMVSPDGRGGYATVFEQVGKVVSISEWSLTASSSDGTTRTYALTPHTTVLPSSSSEIVSTGSRLNIGEVVSIVGTVEGGLTTATVVADQAFANGNGPPMDG